MAGESIRVAAVNAGSSTIKLALYEEGPPLICLAKTQIDRMDEARSTAEGRTVAVRVAEWIRGVSGDPLPRAIAHRVVHGGLRVTDHQIVTPALLDDLRAAESLDPTHLPRQIELIEALLPEFPDALPVACLDTAFHRDLPLLAKLLPIPREYFESGVRRFGFHGLSCAYLMQELRRLAPAGAYGRVILAHLGSGASMTAVRAGKPIDTTMAFTPSSGLMMGTRTGDLDPGLMLYWLREEKRTPDEVDDLVNRGSGLRGVSGLTSDVRELLSRRARDEWADRALDLFCYSAKKWIGALAAALGGLDTIVFSGGIGAHVPPLRAEICEGLDWAGVRLDEARNTRSAPVISSSQSQVEVRVIPTDEEQIMAEIAFRALATAETPVPTGAPHA